MFNMKFEFPATLMPNNEPLNLGLITKLHLFAQILVHELGHALAMRMLVNSSSTDPITVYVAKDASGGKVMWPKNAFDKLKAPVLSQIPVRLAGAALGIAGNLGLLYMASGIDPTQITQAITLIREGQSALNVSPTDLYDGLELFTRIVWSSAAVHGCLVNLASFGDIVHTVDNSRTAMNNASGAISETIHNQTAAQRMLTTILGVTGGMLGVIGVNQLNNWLLGDPFAFEYIKEAIGSELPEVATNTLSTGAALLQYLIGIGIGSSIGNSIGSKSLGSESDS